jgi:predicted small lipoprotein YifL
LTPRWTWARAVLAAACAIVALAGCGLKGALTMPEKSQNVVIRGQPGTTPATGPAGPATGATTTEKAAKPDKMPPPELPRSTTGM